MLKKICDHPLLLTQRAADDIAEGMESMLNAADVAEVEAMSASVTNFLESNESSTESHGALSCKMAFIMVLLVCMHYLLTMTSKTYITCTVV